MTKTAHFHLPGLFEFYDLYKIFLPLFYQNRDWFYPWCDISSIYGSPEVCLWGGGRAGFGENDSQKVLDLLKKYKISARLTFSNSLLQKEHLYDKNCNNLCSLFHDKKNGIIIYSDLLLNYIQKNYPDFYFVSSTTKVLTDFSNFSNELNRSEFKFVVPDFRLNKDFTNLKKLSQPQKDKTEFLCNECCDINCNQRKICYENVSLKNLGQNTKDHICFSKDAKNGYVFSKAIKNPAFIGLDDIQKTYLPLGFSNFKIEGRSLGSAIILEFLLYYLTKPQHQLEVRENIYLDSMLDLF